LQRFFKSTICQCFLLHLLAPIFRASLIHSLTHLKAFVVHLLFADEICLPGAESRGRQEMAGRRDRRTTRAGGAERGRGCDDMVCCGQETGTMEAASGPGG
jgi:hypothetical protein